MKREGKKNPKACVGEAHRVLDTLKEHKRSRCSGAWIPMRGGCGHGHRAFLTTERI